MTKYNQIEKDDLKILCEYIKSPFLGLKLFPRFLIFILLVVLVSAMTLFVKGIIVETDNQYFWWYTSVIQGFITLNSIVTAALIFIIGIIPKSKKKKLIDTLRKVFLPILMLSIGVIFIGTFGLGFYHLLYDWMNRLLFYLSSVLALWVLVELVFLGTFKLLKEIL